MKEREGANQTFKEIVKILGKTALLVGLIAFITRSVNWENDLANLKRLISQKM